MKKIPATLLLILILLQASLQAVPVQAQIRWGYFHFSDRVFRHIYHQDALDVQITASTPVWKFLRLYGGVNYISRHGRSIGGHHRTDIKILPTSLGLQAMIDIAHDVKYYATVGPRYFYLHQRNDFRGVDHSVNGHGIGAFINTGFQLHFGPDFYIFGTDFFIDLFGEYSYCRIPFHSHYPHIVGKTRQIGGLTFGGSFGYQF